MFSSIWKIKFNNMKMHSQNYRVVRTSLVLIFKNIKIKTLLWYQLFKEFIFLLALHEKILQFLPRFPYGIIWVILNNSVICFVLFIKHITKPILLFLKHLTFISVIIMYRISNLSDCSFELSCSLFTHSWTLAQVIACMQTVFSTDRNTTMMSNIVVQYIWYVGCGIPVSTTKMTYLAL